MIDSSLASNLDVINNERGIMTGSTSQTDISTPVFKLQSFQTPNILFIVGDPSSPDAQFDKPFFDFLTNNLSYTVDYHDDNNSFNYQNYDAILISRSILEIDTVDSLYKAEIPILTMEAGTETEFQLGSGFGTTVLSSIYIINNSHYITNNLSQQSTFPLYSNLGEIDYVKGYNAIPTGAGVF